METSDKKSKWEVRVAAVIIFALGFLAGALSLNLYRGHRSFSPWARNHARMEETLGRLDLSGDQRSRVEAILSDARAQLKEIRKQDRPKMIEVRKQTQEKLQAVLSADQWQQFEQVMKERKERPGRRSGAGDDE
jgi:Spy/CpxP family protein refolding chaperone